MTPATSVTYPSGCAGKRRVDLRNPARSRWPRHSVEAPPARAIALARVPLKTSPGAGRRRAAGSLPASVPRRRRPRVDSRTRFRRDAGHRRRARRASLRPRQRARCHGGRAPAPRDRPRRELDSLFAAFRAPFTAYSTATLRSNDARRFPRARLKSRLDSLPRNAPEYAKLFAAFEPSHRTRLSHAKRSAERGSTDVGPCARRIRDREAKACVQSSANGKIAPTRGTTASCGTSPRSDARTR